MKPDRWILFGLSALFLLIASKDLKFPGFHYDEALQVAPAFYLASGRPADSKFRFIVRPAGMEMPLMLNSYSGALAAYVALPLFKVFGYSDPQMLRQYVLYLTAAGLFMSLLFLRNVFGPHIAVLTGIIFATDPSFVLWSRVSFFSHFPVFLFLYSAAGLLVYRYFQKKKGGKMNLFSAGFLAGAGLYMKLAFSAALIPLAAIFIVIQIDQKKTNMTRAVGYLAAGISVGASVMIAYNFISSFETIGALFSSLCFPGSGNDSFIFSVIHAFLIRFKHLFSLLSGGAYDLAGDFYPSIIVPVIFSVSILYLLFRQKKYGWRKDMKISASVFYFICVFFLSVFVTFRYETIQLLLLYPAPFIIISLAMEQMFLPKKLPAYCIAVLIALTNMSVIYSKYNHMRMKDESLYWSTAVYEAGDYMDANGIRSAAALEWGLKYSLEFLTGGKTKIAEIDHDYQDSNMTGYKKNLEKYLSQPQAVFLSYDMENETAERARRYEMFRTEIKERGMAIRKSYVFSGQSGRKVIRMDYVS